MVRERVGEVDIMMNIRLLEWTIRRRRENGNDGGDEWSMVRERVGEVDIMMDIRLLE